MPRKRKPPPIRTPADDFVRAEAGAVARLAASDAATWESLFSLIFASKACPPALVRALLAIDDPEGWMKRTTREYSSSSPYDRMDAEFGFRDWFCEGIVQHLPPTDPAVLRVRYRRERESTEPGAARRARALVLAIEAAGDSQRSLLGRALVLLARRLGEDGAEEDAIAAARRAEDIFAELGDAGWRGDARRERVGALLRLRKLDEALALFDTIDASAGRWLSDAASDLSRTPTDPVDAVLAKAAKLATWATETTPEWIDVLRSIAHATGHRGSAERAARARGPSEPDSASADPFDRWD